MIETEIEMDIQKYLDKGSFLKHFFRAVTIFVTGLLLFLLFVVIKMGIFQDKNNFVREIQKLGFWAPIIFLFLQMIQVVIPIIPGGTSSFIGAFAFGPVLGFFYNYLGIILGSICAYFLSKKKGIQIVKLFFKEETIQKYLDSISEQRFRRIFIIGILFPGFPDDLLCYMAGIRNISFKTFLGCIFVGKFFSMFLYSLFANFF